MGRWFTACQLAAVPATNHPTAPPAAHAQLALHPEISATRPRITPLQGEATEHQPLTGCGQLFRIGTQRLIAFRRTHAASASMAGDRSTACQHPAVPAAGPGQGRVCSPGPAHDSPATAPVSAAPASAPRPAAGSHAHQRAARLKCWPTSCLFKPSHARALKQVRRLFDVDDNNQTTNQNSFRFASDIRRQSIFPPEVIDGLGKGVRC